MTKLTDSVDVLESFRQRVGGTIRNYHTDMKIIEATNEVDEKIEHWVRISTKLVFPDKL